MSNDGYYRLALGDFECVCLSDGGSYYPPEMLIANVPRDQVEAVLRSRNLPTDQIWTPYTYLYVNTGDRQVLVDMGAGSLRPTTGKLLHSMASADIDPGDIDVVLITHAHPDHIGGTLDAEGKPNFTNAHYIIGQREWDFWHSDNALELSQPRPSAERFVTSARTNLDAIRDRVDFLHTEGDVFPGVAMLAAPGHTPGHMAVSFTSNAERLIYVSDTVLYPLHLSHPNWLPIFDILPDEAAVSKRRIFDLVADERTWVIGQHFPPFPSLGHVVKSGNGWEWQPV